MKVAFVGGGRVVSWQIERILQGSNHKINGVFDIDLEVLNKYEKDGINTFKNMEDLIQSGPDVISICTPSNSHITSLKEAFELCPRGQIFTIEKPTFMNFEDYEIAEEFIRKKSIIIFPIFQNRYNNAVQYAKKLLLDDEIGNFLHGRINLSWCRPQRYYELADWRGKWFSDGGALTNQGIHFIDLARYLFGDIQDVSFRMDRAEVNIECENVAVGSLRTIDGRLISIDINTVSRPDDHNAEITIYGNKGFISLGGIASNKVIQSSGDLPTEFNEEFPNAYGYGHEKIFDAIDNYVLNKNKGQILSTFEDSKKTLSVLHASYTSAANSAKIINTCGPFEKILGANAPKVIFN